MAYEINEKSGSLFKNAEKRSDKSPDYSGNLKLAGKLYRVAGWIKASAKGDKYMSLAISEPEAQAPEPKPEMNDSIKF